MRTLLLRPRLHTAAARVINAAVSHAHPFAIVSPTRAAVNIGHSLQGHGFARLMHMHLSGSTAAPCSQLLRPRLATAVKHAPCVATSRSCASMTARFVAAAKTQARYKWGDLKKYKPTSPGRRHRVVINKQGLWRGGPVRSLTFPLKGQKMGGRNHSGRITVWHRKARKHRKLYRMVDFRRQRTDPAVVTRLEYDPNRSSFIALIKYTSDDTLSYILAPEGLEVGHTVQSGEEAPFRAGNHFPLGIIPEGSRVHNVELIHNQGGQICRAAGCSALIQSRESDFVILKLQSGELRKFDKRCKATFGVVGNANHQFRVLGKAGASNWIGRRPTTRGVAMNPVDHPMGGGEGKSSGGQGSRKSPWGKKKGIRTRKLFKFSARLIIRRRNHDKLQLSAKNTRGRSW